MVDLGDFFVVVAVAFVPSFVRCLARCRMVVNNSLLRERENKGENVDMYQHP